MTNEFEKAAIKFRRGCGRASDFRPAPAKRASDRCNSETEAGENEDDRNYSSPAAVSEEGDNEVGDHGERVDNCLGHWDQHP